MKKQLRAAIASAISEVTNLNLDSVDRLLEAPKNSEFGDLAFPCFLVAKERKIPPPLCASQIRDSLQLPAGVAEITTAGPFLNFRYDRPAFTARLVEGLLNAPDELPSEDRRAETVVVEYSSPNIAKPFHVGHLRATLIGNSLDRVYRYLGYNTVSVNHLGDWGTQFGFVWAGCELWGKPQNNSVLGLLEIYRRSTGLKAVQDTNGVKDGDPDVNATARQFFIDLEEGKSYALEFWKWCSDISLEYFKHTYARLNVHFDHYTGESFYSPMLKDVEAELKVAGVLVESEGALGVDLGESLGFARVFTPDGRSLYLTRDLATAMYRADTFGFTRSVYVVGAPQTLHFQQLKGILEKLGKPFASAMIHVAFGHVLGIKTRGEGQFIELNEFLDEATELALDAYRTQVSKRPEGLDEHEVARSVALSAIVFSNLSRTNIKDVHFSWEHAFAFQGDSGPYLLYAYARINGIKERAASAGLAVATRIDPALLPEESAFHLAVAIADFSDVCERTVRDNEPCYLATYALEVAKLISRAYLDLKVLGEPQPLAEARLALFEAARRTLRETLELLGLPVLERM